MYPLDCHFHRCHLEWLWNDYCYHLIQLLHFGRDCRHPGRVHWSDFHDRRYSLYVNCHYSLSWPCSLLCHRWDQMYFQNVEQLCQINLRLYHEAFGLAQLPQRSRKWHSLSSLSTGAVKDQVNRHLNTSFYYQHLYFTKNIVRILISHGCI